MNATTSARNKSYENVLTICHAGIEAVPWSFWNVLLLLCLISFPFFWAKQLMDNKQCVTPTVKIVIRDIVFRI